MRRKFLVAILLLLPLSLFASYWQVGVEAGYTLGFYTQDGGEREGKSFRPGSAFEIAIPVEFRAQDWVSITTGVRYIGKSYGTEKIYNNIEMYRYRSVEHFLEIPLGIRLSAGNDEFRLFAGGGFFLGARFLSTEMGNMDLLGFIGTSDYNNYWSVLDLDPASDGIFSAGLFAEAGGSMTLGDGELYLAVRYQYPLTGLDGSYQERHIGRYIDTLSITLGYSFFVGGR